MLLTEYNKLKLSKEVTNFYDDLANIFLKKDYTNNRYNLSENFLKNNGSNEIDYDFLYFTEEGNSLQDKYVLDYHTKELIEDLKKINVYINENIYLSENVAFSNGIDIFTWEKIESKLSNDKIFYEYKKPTNNNYKLSLAAGVALIHQFGITKTLDFLKESKNVYIDENLIPMPYYMQYFLKFDISSIVKVEKNKEKIVFEKKDDEDKKILDKVDEKNEFIGQNPLKDLESQLKDIKKSEILKIVKEYIDNNKEKEIIKNNEDLTLEKNLNYENQDLKQNKKYILDYNKKIGEKLKEKYIKENYNENPSNYLEDTTNKLIETTEKNDINEILKDYEEATKNNDENIGNVIRQKGFNNFRNFKEKKINIIDTILMILRDNEDNELEILEKSLKKYSCKYIKESKATRALNLVKNVFLSKVSEFINNSLHANNINLDVDLSEYNYLEFGIKDIDDLNAKNGEKILKILKRKNLIKKSYSVDKNGIRKFPRSRRFFDNILIEYFKKKINFKGKYFDNVDDKNRNLVRLFVIYIDELINGLDEKYISIFRPLGDSFNISKLLYTILKNKIIFREKSLIFISNIMENLKYEEYTDSSNLENDKKFILSIFPNYVAMINFFKLKNSINIAYFFTVFYKYNIEVEKELESIVTHNSKLSCSCGVGISSFSNLKNKKIKVLSEYAITSNNNEIFPFQSCSLNKVCVPNLLNNWINTHKININNNEILTNNSKIMCTSGGIISILDNKQNKLKKSIVKKNIEKNSNNVKNIKELNYKNKNTLEDFLEENVFDHNTKFSLITLISNPHLFKKTLEFMIKSIGIRLDSNFNSNLSDENINIKRGIYFENKIFDISDIENNIKDYYLSFIDNTKENILYKKYGKSLNSKNFLENYLKDKNYVNFEYDDKENKNENIELPWMKILKKEYDNFKDKSKEKLLNFKIIEYHRIGGGINANREVPWCASFANWILYNSGIKIQKTPSSLIMKNNLKKINKEVYGAILILRKYDLNGKKTNNGHVTFLTEIIKNKYICLGGNQDRKIKYSKYTKNGKTSIRNGYLKVEGIYWPKEYEVDDRLILKGE